jgi:2-amino-4-hydroxy-6-hydroxymethyldihydropteridine diphosphokinase
MEVYLSLGANLGNREQNLASAISAINNLTGKSVAVSHIYETVPVGFESNDLFLNMVVAVETDLTPFKLLDEIKNIEISLGRIREHGKYISRTIDIDILFCDDQIIESSELMVPHPRLHERRFVLVPFCDIDPDFIHPILQKSIKELLFNLKDTSRVIKY